MKWIDRNEIDTEKWNNRVKMEENASIFCFSWYLDAVAENWGALISDNYATILPVPYTIRMGLRQMIQPTYTRELEIIGTNFSWQDVIPVLKNEFRKIEFRSGIPDILPDGQTRTHQYISFKDFNETFYSSNARRILKKAGDQFEITNTGNIDNLIDLFRKTAFTKIDSLHESDLARLKKLMQNAIQENHGQLMTVTDQHQTVATGFFLSTPATVTYLKGASTEDAKKEGAMYFLFDQAIKKFSTSHKIFDFGGSDIKSVADFYKKFGAHDRTYFNYTFEQLPAWFKTLKKLKR